MSTPSISSASGEILINNGDLRVTDATAVLKCSAGGLMFSDNSTLTTAPGGAQNLQGVVDTGNVCTEVVSLVNNTLSISTGGPVGVGTASPTAALSVVGTAPYSPNPADAGIHIGLSGTGAGQYATIEMVGRDNQCLIDFSKPGASADFYRLVSNIGGVSNLEFYGPDGTSTPALAIDVNSNVGISTRYPTEKLEVAGNIKASGYVEAGVMRLEGLTESYNAYIDFAVPANSSTGDFDGRLIFNQNSTSTVADQDLRIVLSTDGAGTAPTNPNMKFTRDGKVGINTASPAEALDVAGNIKTSGTITTAGYIHLNSAANGGLVFRGSPDTDLDYVIENRNATGADRLVFSTGITADDTSHTPALIIMKATGHVGIGSGITSASEALDVAGNIKASGHIECPTIYSTSYLGANGSILPATAAAAVPNVRPAIMVRYGEPNSATELINNHYGMAFYGLEDTTKTAVIETCYTGNAHEVQGRIGNLCLQPHTPTSGYTNYVGIGTTSPAQKLHVAGSIKATVDVRAPGISNSDNAGGGYIFLSTDGANRYYCSGTHFFLDGSNNDNDIRCSSIFQSSDDRLKHNEVLLSNAVSLINQLTIYEYDKTRQMMDSDFNGDLSNVAHTKEVGVIAQEVESLTDLSFVVNAPSDTSNAYAVRYGSLHNIGLKAIQELSAENTTLKSQVADLLTRVQALENP